jgi:hypothetical protein
MDLYVMENVHLEGTNYRWDSYGLNSLTPGNPGIICPNLPVGSAICIATFFNPCDFGLSLTPLERAFNSATKKHFYTWVVHLSFCPAILR